ncbi:ParB/RepB/Spo0J family partition protein [Neochlamydia sp. AcF65]|uniref:ParB/RepB/Spo0J family partition protein n=1 Tax=Neochlamydia sp. AcF65 TaxID=2795735 RepID=UPI001BCA5104|nr:ParB/RepB/Spo0J family partition protein [Neochlamydia sp. AcF65]
MNVSQEKLSLFEELRYVPLNHINISPFQPRRQFAESELKELAESIKAVGLIHPPIVRTVENSSHYELVAGERRFRAAKLAGLFEIPVLVRSSSHILSAQAALIENIQRVDLNPIEISKALFSLMEEFKFSQEKLAASVGKKRSTIANYLRLLSLPNLIQDSLSKNLITMGHAKAILAVEGAEKQVYLHELILRESLSVRETEKAVQKLKQKIKHKKLSYETRDFYLEQLAEKLQYKLGTKVFIRAKGRQGRISIDYFNLDDLERLLEALGVRE